MRGWRLSPLGAVLFGLLLVAIVLTFTGSSTLQVIGFVAIVIIIMMLVSDQLTVRFGRLGQMTQGRADTRPDTARRLDDPAEQEEAWQREEARRHAHEHSAD